MADILLVHGAWHGAWCWRRVLPLLWAAGHRPHAVTLTGLGERRRELSRDVTLATHIDDVRTAIAVEEMDPVVLVGHSYAGMVITGAAAGVPTVATDGAAAAGSPSGTTASRPTVERLIYLDAFVPAPGESWSSGQDAETVRARTVAADANGGALPPPDPAVFGLAGADRDWVARQQTPHPFAPFREPLAFDAARWRAIPRSFIDCIEPSLATIAASRRRVRQQGDWDLHELKAGHDPMIEVPEQLVALLDRIVRSSTSIR
jgi:pimeloyl-ACP methyl ester carboxylesterase